MERIYALDKILSKAFADFAAISDEIDLPLICDLSDDAPISRLTYSGIYRIDIATLATPDTSVSAWMQAFRAEWEHEDYKRKFTPNLKKKRINRHRSLPEWLPLYLGKSRNVGARVLEHLNLGLDKTTFALKLRARPTMATRAFRLHVLELRVENYDLIAPALEAALRDRFNPIVGKQ
ncbi:hypothetical protein [Burkholderia cepacia]|uniref:hypothetical protein n=1 Tax=Burkholderia cepacia TaxID=292 RepID=UPI0035272D86